jgi:hypothetical protein
MLPVFGCASVSGIDVIVVGALETDDFLAELTVCDPSAGSWYFDVLAHEYATQQ